jgi:hypothetical protein
MDVPRALQMLGLCRTHCCATWFVEVEAVGRCVVASAVQLAEVNSLFGWLVADGWCWFVMREEYCWLVAAGCWWLVSCERKVLLAGG